MSDQKSPGVSVVELHENVKEPTFLGVVRYFSELIENGRTLRSIFLYSKEQEMQELDDEITKVEKGEPEGDDGVVGEAIDNMLCHADLIIRHRPDITEEDFMAIVIRKCEKWYVKHADKRVDSE
jgi:hypothetical protein